MFTVVGESRAMYLQINLFFGSAFPSQPKLMLFGNDIQFFKKGFKKPEMLIGGARTLTLYK